MPPARLTLVRSNARTVDLSNRREELKPYKEPVELSRTIKQYGGEKKVHTKNGFSTDYMDIDEFFQNTTSQHEEDQNEEESQDEDKDYPKPQVDLLASLLTLGKMIQDQKQLMARQSSRRVSTDNIDIENEALIRSEPVVSSCITNETNDDSNKIDEIEITEDNNDQLIEDKIDNVDELNSSQDTNSLSELNITYSESLQSTITSLNKIPKTNTTSNEKMPFSSSSSEENSRRRRTVIPDSIKDGDYWDRRRRNNLAAKKSREERRKKELDVLEAANRLSKENMQLTAMLKRLTARNELLESKLLKIRKRQREGETSAGTGTASSDCNSSA